MSFIISGSLLQLFRNTARQARRETSQTAESAIEGETDLDGLDGVLHLEEAAGRREGVDTAVVLAPALGHLFVCCFETYGADDRIEGSNNGKRKQLSRNGTTAINSKSVCVGQHSQIHGCDWVGLTWRGTLLLL